MGGRSIKEGLKMVNEDRLKDKMRALNIKEEDIEEAFVRSSGPGGQNVNKVATCVVLYHRPSGIQIKCQEERSQYANRLRAIEMLIDKIEEEQRSREAQRRSKLEKIRRRNRPKPQSLKEEILHNKKAQGQKKKERKKVLATFDD